MKYNINKVAVLGAGVMGSGIAAHFVGAGIPVMLLDIVPRDTNEKEKAAGLTLESKAVRNRIADEAKKKIVNPKSGVIYDKGLEGLIQTGNFTDDLKELGKCDFIIEAIVERMDIKQGLMKNIADYVKKGAIIASNTSGLSIDEISQGLPQEYRQHFIGVHYFNPVRYMKLLELIPCVDTNPELVEYLKAFGTRRLGKDVVVAKDNPNFIGSRLGTQVTVTAMREGIKAGYSIPEIDLLTGMIIGRPKSASFKLIDIVGIDIFSHVTKNMHDTMESEYEKYCNLTPQIAVDMVEKGKLGNKTREGFYKTVKTADGLKRYYYDYNKDEYVDLVAPKIKAVEEAKKERGLINQLNAIVWGETDENKFVWNIVKDNLLYTSRNIPEMTDDYKDVDIAMKSGFNWIMGPFEIWNAIGVEKSIQRMKEEGEEIPKWVTERIAKGKINFYEDSNGSKPYIHLNDEKYNKVFENKGAVLKNIGDGVLCLEFVSKSNTINDDVNAAIMESVSILENNNEYIGMVIANHGKNFCVGGQLDMMAERIKAKEWKELEYTVTGFQIAEMAVKYATKPIVSCAHGQTLGGGCELAIASYKQVIHVETYMGLVEPRVGLIPAGGGTKETLINYTANMGKVNLVDRVNQLKHGFENLMNCKVSKNAYDAMNYKYVKANDIIKLGLDYIIDDAKREIINIYDEGFKPRVKKEIVVTGTTGLGALQYMIDFKREGKFITDYDAVICGKLANILSGGNVVPGAKVSEEWILELEKESFMSLCGETKTLERIEYMLKNKKGLKN